MQTAKLFQNARSQAVRLPAAFRFSGNEGVVSGIDARHRPNGKQSRASMPDLPINKTNKRSLGWEANKTPQRLPETLGWQPS